MPFSAPFSFCSCLSRSLEHFPSFFLSRMLRCIRSQTKAERFFSRRFCVQQKMHPGKGSGIRALLTWLCRPCANRHSFWEGGRFEVCPPSNEGTGCSWVCYEDATLYFCFYLLKQRISQGATSHCGIIAILIVTRRELSFSEENRVRGRELERILNENRQKSSYLPHWLSTSR